MLRVTPLMLHHYCPLLWCDHVRVGKLSASQPPPQSLPLSEWVWRDHEPSFTQLLRCRVQVQDPEIISSKIIWASLKNTFTKQKIYSENSVPAQKVDYHFHQSAYPGENSKRRIAAAGEEETWQGPLVPCPGRPNIMQTHTGLGWADWAGLGWAGLGWATLPSMQFTHTQAPTPNIHHYLRITTCKYGPELGTYFPWELHCGCSLWLNLKVNTSRLAFGKLLCIECYNLHAMWTSKYSKV